MNEYLACQIFDKKSILVYNCSKKIYPIINVVMNLVHHVKRHSKTVACHIKKHHKKYLAGFFGSFAVVKLVALVL
jgi:hypothetical protein